MYYSLYISTFLFFVNIQIIPPAHTVAWQTNTPTATYLLSAAKVFNITPLDGAKLNKMSMRQLEIHLTNGMSMNGLLIFPSDILHRYWTLIGKRYRSAKLAAAGQSIQWQNEYPDRSTDYKARNNPL